MKAAARRPPARGPREHGVPARARPARAAAGPRARPRPRGWAELAEVVEDLRLQTPCRRPPRSRPRPTSTA